MKQAFLITAYKNFTGLFELVSLLARDACVYVHIDKSGEITKEQIEELNKVQHCQAISHYKIAWGGFCHVSAILDLLKLACDNPEVSYVHVMTGEDMLLKTVRRLDDKYLDNAGIYMDCIPMKDFTPQVQKRYYYHNWFADKNVKNPLLWQLQNVTVNLQKLLGVKRSHLGEFSNEQIYKGLVYVSMPRAAALYVTEYCMKHPEFLKDLRDCQIPEEFFFQTLLMNSEYAADVSGDRIRYVNWEKGDGGSPAYLDMGDYDAIREGDYDFARKFHPEISKELKECLDL